MPLAFKTVPDIEVLSITSNTTNGLLAVSTYVRGPSYLWKRTLDLPYKNTFVRIRPSIEGRLTYIHHSAVDINFHFSQLFLFPTTQY